MLRPSLAAVWGSFFCLNLRCQITRFHLRQQHKKTTPYLLSGWGAVLPNPGLIHSLTAPGGLLALQDLSCPLSVHSCHFTRTPNHFSARVGVPDSQFNAFFFLQRRYFSFRLQSLSLSGSPRPPAHQMLGSLCVSAGSLLNTLCMHCRVFFTFYCAPANKVQAHRRPKLV